MSTDFAFMFMPGDYLRDTQCLSEKVQVAYDRIMCEHMRNICISKERINFFAKKLNDDEKYELMSVLSQDDGGYFIEWVRASIEKRNSYIDSRKKNRAGNPKKNINDISETYDTHMEDEIEYKDKYDSLLKKVLEKNSITLPEGFNDLILKWLKYKSEKNQSYKETGLISFINKFLKDSEGSLTTAQGMLEYSMSKNYTGLFKEKTDGINQQPNTRGIKRVNELWREQA